MVKEFNKIQAFKSLYLEHFKAVAGFCNSCVHDEEVAMDIAQDTFFKLYQQYDESYSRENVQGFIYITAKNQCMDYLRRAKFKMVDVEDVKDQLLSDSMLLDEITRQEMIQCIHRAIEQLSGRGYQIARLALQGKSNQEIAEDLNISINSVKTLKKEMYQKLRKIIGNEYILCVLLKFFV